MPVYDVSCRACGNLFEVIEPVNTADPRPCPQCGGEARRIISASGCFTGNNDASWVRSVTDVVAKGPDADAHDRRFLKSAKTKQDLSIWMKAKGLRHLEKGEPRKPNGPDMSDAADKVMRMRYERRAINLRTR